jgi:cytochrome d ubiquinol oxidase subunit II
MLDTLPLVFVLSGLTLYVVLGGADFGAGIWQMLSGPGKRGEEIREHAHHSMGPVWEANHVWLIFVLTVSWTAYPTLVGSMASTLAVAFFIAGLGIILRGATYALRPGLSGGSRLIVLEGAFALASLVTPFALGAAAGAIAAERVPVGNAAGPLFSSWLNPTSILIGVLAVAFSVYLAAVYLAADAARRHEAELEEAFRRRALLAGVVAGGLSLAGLIVVRSDARSLYTGLVHGAALGVMIVSVLAGMATLALVYGRRFEIARASAALAVAAVIAGWALARYPTLLPGLTVHQAAASHDTLVTLVVAVIGGGILLFPALGLLFALTLRGRLGGPGPAQPTVAGEPGAGAERPPLRDLLAPAAGARLALALLIVGVGLLNAANAPWAHAVGVVSLFGFVIVGFTVIVPRALTTDG